MSLRWHRSYFVLDLRCLRLYHHSTNAIITLHVSVIRTSLEKHFTKVDSTEGHYSTVGVIFWKVLHIIHIVHIL
jgi:hypothetical protein